VVKIVRVIGSSALVCVRARTTQRFVTNVWDLSTSALHLCVCVFVLRVALARGAWSGLPWKVTAAVMMERWLAAERTYDCKCGAGPQCREILPVDLNWSLISTDQYWGGGGMTHSHGASDFVGWYVACIYCSIAHDLRRASLRSSCTPRCA